MANPSSGGLTTEQKAQATKAAKDILWHQRQVDRWEPLYQRAAAAQQVAEAERIGGIIDAHNQAIDAAREVLESFGI